MKKMPNTDKQERVSALFADSDRGQCSAIRLYGSAQQAVAVCAAVTTGQQVLEILRSGLCPQVLVLDTLLQGPGLGELLWQLGTLDLPDRPRVLVTAMPCTQQLSLIHIFQRRKHMEHFLDPVGTVDDSGTFILAVRQGKIDVIPGFFAKIPGAVFALVCTEPVRRKEKFFFALTVSAPVSYTHLYAGL